MGKWGKKERGCAHQPRLLPELGRMLLAGEGRIPSGGSWVSSTEDEVSQVMSQHNAGVGQGKASTGCPEAFKC